MKSSAPAGLFLYRFLLWLLNVFCLIVRQPASLHRNGTFHNG
ncbi:hypothetical protein P262_00617 [Cronobacter malonaticus]|uniref:Uncharacterized protein n=1 Tax=Cronobacter malonaticus TaxID=413503 RepID=V5TVU1_9ENTR|nr:hypothetical protein P262_00617 [Cronobacter malonaticus]CCJ94305.1 hypothetical protein BN131_1978 [Cronobacter malonaticus 681]CCJ99704.1 hypothetical protein BN130_2420 [Cronobacter malonaticus 507]